MKGGSRKQTARQQLVCAVCHLKMPENDTQERLTCGTCNTTVHRNCYSPQFEEKAKVKFKCDECRHAGKGKERSCLACGKGRESGLLKNVGGDQWAHVLCALASPRLKLVSYRTLVFHAGKAAAQRKSAKGTRCINCNYQKSPGLMCVVVDCQHYMHLNCVALMKSQEVGDDYSAFLTIGLLDRHQNALLNHLKNMEQPIPFKGLDLYPLPPPELRFFICQEHNTTNDYFVWCHCNGQGLPEGETVDLKQCERCSRWFHTDYCGGNQYCSGCTNNNPYERNLTLPQLVSKAIQAETATFDKVQVKFLDHFCLKLSVELEKVIEKGSYEVQRYYLRKALEDTDLSDPNQLNSALEILYYLSKKQRKSKDDITPEEIEQIIKAESKLNKYEWNNKSQPRVEKRFKTKLQDLLKAIRKDGTRYVKLKLHEFIKKNESVAVRTHKDIAADLEELVKSLEASEGWKENYSDFPNRDPERHLIQFFYEMKFTQEETVSVLGALKILFNLKDKGVILQSDYKAISTIFDRVLPQHKRKIFQSLFNRLKKGLCLRKIYMEKQQIRQELQSRLKCSRNGKDREIVKQSIFSNRLLVTSASPLLQIQKDSIELAVLRRKAIRNSQDPSPHQLPDVKILLSKLLELDTRIQGLSAQQRRGFEQTQTKLAFYESLSNFMGEAMVPEAYSSSSSMVDQNSEGAPQSQGKRIQRPIRSLNLRERAIAAIMDGKWIHTEAITIALTEAHKLATKGIIFDETQRKIINQFCQTIVDFYNRVIQTRQTTPSGCLIEKLYKVAEYSNCLGSYPIIKELYEVFDEWKKDLDSIDDIQKALQTTQRTETLLQLVSGRIEAGDELGGGIDISTELRKLRAVRLWCQLSLKLQQGNRSTITAIQATKSLMDRIHYPNNCLRRRVQALQAESKTLNTRISQFLERPKTAQLEIYQQQKLMAGKMTIEEAQKLQSDLQRSKLDVQVELQELVQQIRDFKALPKNLSALIQNNKIEELQALKRRLFQSSFRLEDAGLQFYHRLLTRITQLKCLDYKPGTQINRKEYFRLLGCGPAGARLFSETSSLYKGYRDVQKAEKEILSSKPRPDNLLPSDCRQIREDLSCDTVELAKVNRWFVQSQKLKERYKAIRISRMDISQLTAVQTELQRLPINNQNIFNDIAALRKQLDDLSRRVRNFLQSCDSTMTYNSPFVMELVAKYQQIGVRNQYLDRFQRLFNNARMIYDFAKQPFPDHYSHFCRLCGDFPELSRSDEIYRIRQIIFDQLAAMYLGSSENMMELGCTLFKEGGYLMSHPNRVPKVLEVMQEIQSRFNKWDARGGVEDSEEMEDGGVMGDEDEDEDEDQMMDDDIDEDSYMSDESSSSHRNLKRPKPNEVVELDDD